MDGIDETSRDDIDPALATLAQAYGVATFYADDRGRRQRPSRGTVLALLDAFGVDATTEEACAEAQRDRDLGPWREVVPPSTVIVRGRGPNQVRLHLPEGATPRVDVITGGGDERHLDAPGPVTGRQRVDGLSVERRHVELPGDLPLGSHRLRVTLPRSRDEAGSGALLVAPAACPDLTDLPPLWGWMLQLPAVRSAASWEIGDAADLRQMAVASAADGAGFLLVNPLHAMPLVPPLQPSPYSPSSRRFPDPMMLRVEDVPEFHTAPGMVRDRVGRLAEAVRTHNRDPRLQRDRAWEAKRDALSLLHSVPMERERAAAFHTWRRTQGQALEELSTFAVLAEERPGPWRSWPRELRRPGSRGVVGLQERLSQRITFHCWLQWCIAEQLDQAQTAAVAAGMPVGVIHDLAVGADPDGADAWALQDELAVDVTVGAPPDAFNRLGQDWGLTPLRPDRLRSSAYLPFRQMVSGVLASAGGLRIDHVMGLFRQWWVPPGADPSDGAYVGYPARELLAVLALEATRAGAVVIGEDLGTVEDGVREALAEARIASSAVVWFAREEVPAESTLPLDEVGVPDDPAGRRLPAAAYPVNALASVTTHDLPTAAGWWEDAEVELAERLSLLPPGADLRRIRASKADDREELRAVLAATGVLADPAEADADVLAEATHHFLARCASRLVAVQPLDALGDRRQPNVPGTVHTYPNWCLPLAEQAPEGARPILLETFLAHPRVRRLVSIFSHERPRV